MTAPRVGRRTGLSAVVLLFGLVKNLENALRRGDRRLKNIGDIGCLDDGMREMTRILDKGLHIAEGDPALNDKYGANHADQYVANVIDKT